MKKCLSCGAFVEDGGLCPKCGSTWIGKVADRRPSSRSRRPGASWAPVLSAIWPGLGQVYEENKMGPIIMLVYGAVIAWLFAALSQFAASVTAGMLYPDKTFIAPALIALVIWLGSVYGAYHPKTYDDLHRIPILEAEEPATTKDD